VESGVGLLEACQGQVHGAQDAAKDEVNVVTAIHEDFAHLVSTNLNFEHQSAWPSRGT
jgi:hypothetical protein